MINNKLFRGFTFDGVNSLDYDIYITGEGVYNAPERAVEKVSVPGRNGDLTIDQGRFENIEVTYAQCGCAAKTQAELAEKVAAFRNALCSRVGYKRLTDDYNKDEYRMAMYVSGLEVEAIAQHRMGTFDIVFDAKPQRFLYTGETPRLLVQGMTPKNPQTESGAIVSVESDGADKVTSLVAQIEPVQAGSGDPSPTNVRAITGWTAANVFVTNSNYLSFVQNTVKANVLSNVTISDISDNEVTLVSKGVATYNRLSRFIFLKNGAYAFKFQAESSGAYTPVITIYNAAGQAIANNVQPNTLRTFTVSADQIVELRMFATTNPTVAGRVVRFYDVMLTQGTTINEFIPFKGTTYPVSFGSAGTVYGGTVDVVTGVLTIDTALTRLKPNWAWQKFDMGGGKIQHYTYTLPSELTGYESTRDTIAVCNMFKGIPLAERPNYNKSIYTGSTGFCVRYDEITTTEDFVTFLTNNEVIASYKITPQTYNLTAQQVELLTGNNHVWADTGDITLTYGDDPYKVVNPTLFESKPLLKVTGRGTLSVGDVTMTITGTASQVLYIDCDIMEVYSITDGQMQPQNSLVTMNSYDFPKLKPGANKITLGVGITQVVVTPRWWRI